MEDKQTQIVSEGQFYQFGQIGNVYEVISINCENARIRVIESGEELDYPLVDISNDIMVS